MKSATPAFPLRQRLLCFSVAVLAVCAVSFASAQTENVIHRFGTSGDGALPVDGLVADNSGALYGATSSGGISCSQNLTGCGVIFKLRPPATVGGTWAENILYKFTGGNDGGNPSGGLLLNSSTGKIYGSAFLGGVNSRGVIYELDPGTPWSQTILHSFSGPDGQNPNGFLQLVHGRIIGSTANGGANHDGVVFALNSPTSSGGSWTERVLHVFNFSVDGLGPRSVIADATGALYGTTTNGGGSGLLGTVWKLSPPSGSGPWSLTTLRGFTNGSDGGSPNGIVLGSDGNLYGVTAHGGDPTCQCGTVFQLVPPSGGTGPWTLNTLYTFLGGTDGSFPSNVVMNSSGAIYGTAQAGGFVCQLAPGGCGVVFALTPPSGSGGSWTETALYAFQGNASGATDGQVAIGKPFLLNGNIYGVTQFGGGNADVGTVFEVVP